MTLMSAGKCSSWAIASLSNLFLSLMEDGVLDFKIGIKELLMSIIEGLVDTTPAEFDKVSLNYFLCLILQIGM